MIKGSRICQCKNKTRLSGCMNLTLNVINPNNFKCISSVTVIWQEHARLHTYRGFWQNTSSSRLKRVQCSDLFLTKGFSNRNRAFPVSNNRTFRLGAGWSGVRFPIGIKKLFYPPKLPERSSFLPNPYSESRGIFLLHEKGIHNVNLTIPLLLVPSLRSNGTMPQLPLYSVDKKNQLDVTFCIFYFSSNSCSTYFGQPCAHHQELTSAWCYSLVLVCAVAAGRWSSPVGM